MELLSGLADQFLLIVELYRTGFGSKGDESVILAHVDGPDGFGLFGSYDVDRDALN